MELPDFLHQINSEVRTEVDARLEEPGTEFPFEESVFSQIVMQHMFDIGMSYEPEPCYYSKKVGNTKVRISGYGLSDEADQIDLFVTIYSGNLQVVAIPDSETKQAAEHCLSFLSKCVSGKLRELMEESDPAFALASTLNGCYSNLNQIRIFVLTDRVAKSKSFKSREVLGKTIKLEVMDIERLFRHMSEGKPRDEILINFVEISGGPIPCVYVPNQSVDYDYAMTVIPGDALRFIYEKYGARLLEANVRSFLSVTGKVNKGIRETLVSDPEHFMAYNNGIVIVTDEASLLNTESGGPGIGGLKGVQIVNGGQTTASLYFTKKSLPNLDLSRVRVPAKIIILKSQEEARVESLISDISKYANSQNSVRQSDLSANKPFHIALEKLSETTYCPDGVGRWFYERAAGSYKTFLARNGSTAAKLRDLREVTLPTSRKVTKTDLAKYLNCWEQRPDLVSLGSQKNFEKFMAAVATKSDEYVPDVAYYKCCISKAIIFKGCQALIRSEIPAFQANVTAYTVSVISMLLGETIDLEKIWMGQSISSELKSQAVVWAREINNTLHSTSNGRMISEWAKKEDCWFKIKQRSFSAPRKGIPELA